MAARYYRSKWAPTPLLSPEQKRNQESAGHQPVVTQLSRLVVILKLSWFVWSREMLRWLFATFTKNRRRSVRTARKIRIFAERLGGIWVSLARLLSLRSDLLGVEFCRELALTRDRGVPLPLRVVRNLVDEELRTLGTSFAQVFAHFDEEPLAVRSFGQFHRARMRKGDREVVVRVRSPYVMQRAQVDWRYMRLSFFLIQQFGVMPHLRWRDLLLEVKKYTDNLLDFRIHQSQLGEVSRILRKQRIYTPAADEKLCTERLLITEYVSGVSIAEMEQAATTYPERYAAWLQENKIDCRIVWRKLFEAHQQLLFEHNCFYTDPSPATILVLKENRIAFVGYNIIGKLDADLQRRYTQLYRALLNSDFTKVADIYLALGAPIPYKDLAAMRTSAAHALYKWEARTHIKKCPYQQKSMSAVLLQLAHCASEHGYPTSWSLARLHFAEQILDQSLGFLDSSQSSIKAMRRYQRAAEQRIIQSVSLRKSVQEFNGALDSAKLGMQLLENYEHDGEYMRRRLLGSHGAVGQISEIIGRLFLLFVRLGLVFSAVHLYRYLGKPYPTSSVGIEQSTLSRLMMLMHTYKQTTWVIFGVFAFLVLSFVQRMARSIFFAEIGPSRRG